jgi:hypothetical protein
MTRIIQLAPNQFQPARLNDFEVTISQDRKSANVRFDFINPSEGAVFQVVRTGAKSRDLSLSGTISDAGSPNRTYGGKGDQGGRINGNVVLAVGMVTGSLLTIFTFYMLSSVNQPEPKLMELPLALRTGIGVAVVFGVLMYLYEIIRVVDRVSQLPKGLDKYDEDL